MPHDIQKHVGNRIREARRRDRLTQGQLAARAGLSPKVLGEIERGAGNPTLTTLTNLSQALGLPITHFLGDGPSLSADAGGRFLTTSELRRIDEALKAASLVLRRPRDDHARTRRRTR